MLKEKTVVGLTLSLLLLPFFEVSASEYEYDWLQKAQLRTFQNKKLREKQAEEKVKTEESLKKTREEEQKIREEIEKEEQKAREEERQTHRAEILKDAETEKRYYEYLKEKSDQRKKEDLEQKQQARLEKQNWTKLLTEEKNKDYLETRTNYSTRKIKSGYLQVSKQKKTKNKGFIGTYMEAKTSENIAKRRTNKPNTFRGFYRRMAQ